MTRRVQFVVGALLVLLAALAGGAYWIYASLDHRVARAIRQWGPEVAGVGISLEGVTIKPIDGKGTLTGFAVANPPGFPASPALRADNVTLDLDVATLGRDVIVVRSLVLESPEIRYEPRASGSNLDAIRHNIEQHVRQYVPEKSALPEKRLLIENLVVRNARILVPARGADGDVHTATLQLHLRGIGKARGGAFPGEIAREIWTPLAQSVALTANEPDTPSPESAPPRNASPR